MPEIDVARLVHHMDGRARFRVDQRRGDVAWFTEVVKAFGTLDGILTATARPETASLLLRHRLSTDELARFALERAFFTVAAPDDDAATAQLLALMPGPLSEPQWRMLAAAGLAGIATLQAARGELFGPALTHLMQAAGLFASGRRKA